MKKILVLVTMLVVGLAFVANAAETKVSTKVTGDTTKTVVKGPEGKVVETVVDKKNETTTKLKVEGKQGKMTEKVVEKSNETTAKTEIKGKNLNVKREVTETANMEVGKTKVKVKHGAIKELSVDWTYTVTPDNNYVLEYTIKERNDKNMAKELGLTPEQAAEIAPGSHKIVSTSPYTADDARNDFRSLIARDLKDSVLKKRKK